MSWAWYAVLSAAGAALVAIFGKLGVSKVDTTLATTIRVVIMAAFFLGVSLILGKAKLLGTVDRSALGYITLSALAGAISWLCYFLALRYGPASGVAALDRTSVVMVFLLAVLFLGEKFTLVHATGAVLVVAGAILLSLK